MTNRLIKKVADVQQAIVHDFGQVAKLSWLGASFALGSAATILPWYVLCLEVSMCLATSQEQDVWDNQC